MYYRILCLFLFYCLFQYIYPPSLFNVAIFSHLKRRSCTLKSNYFSLTYVSPWTDIFVSCWERGEAQESTINSYSIYTCIDRMMAKVPPFKTSHSASSCLMSFLSLISGLISFFRQPRVFFLLSFIFIHIFPSCFLFWEKWTLAHFTVVAKALF